MKKNIFFHEKNSLLTMGRPLQGGYKLDCIGLIGLYMGTFCTDIQVCLLMNISTLHSPQRVQSA